MRNSTRQFVGGLAFGLIMVAAVSAMRGQANQNAAKTAKVRQADIIRKLIAEKPNAITVVPNSPEALEDVLKQARAAGIKVVTHEAGNQVNTDVDIEAFDNLAFGSYLMDQLASCMGRSGKYVAFVGHTTARSHMRWAGAAYDRAKQKYPKIERISAPVETDENQETAYQKAKELLAKNPDLKGFEGSSVVDVAGIGRRLAEASILVCLATAS